MTKCSVGFKSGFYFYPKERERESGKEGTREIPVRERTKREMQVYMHSRYAAAALVGNAI